MGGAAARQNRPPQPARNAASTLTLRSVGGAEASQNGFGDLTPRKLVRRSAIGSSLSGARCAKRSRDRARRLFAILDGAHRQVLAAVDAIPAGPHALKRRAALGIDDDASVLDLDRRAVERFRRTALPDGEKQHVG